VPQAHKVPQDHKGHKAIRVPQDQVQLALLDSQEPQDHKDPPELQVPQVQVPLVLQVPLD
jgi:hypothetical protein